MNELTDSPLIRRLTTLKYTLDQSALFFAKNPDEYAVSVGVCLLHDSIENLFWSIASYSKVTIKDRGSLPEKLATLKTSLKKEIVFDNTTIEDLNTMRNAFKHHAVPVNIGHALNIKDKIAQDYLLTVKNIFKTDLSDISLSNLITNKDIRMRIKEIESVFYKGKNDYLKYKETLRSVGKVYFDLQESSELTSLSILIRDSEDQRLGKKLKRYLFYDPGIDTISRDFLEIGIAPYYYYRFKNLVPTFGKDRESDIVIAKYPVNWDKVNWTEVNAKFCLNWLIDFFLKRQMIYERGTFDIKNNFLGCQIITPKEDIETSFVSLNPARQFKIKFIKNIKYLANFIYYQDGTWYDYDEEETDISFLVIYLKPANIRGEINKKLFDIEEVNLDELTPFTHRTLIQNNQSLVVLT